MLGVGQIEPSTYSFYPLGLVEFAEGNCERNTQAFCDHFQFKYVIFRDAVCSVKRENGNQANEEIADFDTSF